MQTGNLLKIGEPVFVVRSSSVSLSSVLLNMRHTKWGLFRRGGGSKRGEERTRLVNVRWVAPVEDPDHDAMIRAVDVDKDIESSL